ncbi:MAG: DUF6340 family protein [Bacteroidia bacterium]|nr:DUF6340 family protein [Bacteroidia bacterium]MDW8088299.1 DUF6340 family protein [Bacteroidia bacterium]
MRSLRVYAAGFSLAILLIACSKPYYTVDLRNWKPSEIELPASIQKVALVNRSSIPEADRKRIMEAYKKRGIAEGALRGLATLNPMEAAMGATSGAIAGIIDEKWLERAPQASLRHLHDRLNECGRFQPIMAGLELQWRGTLEGSLPPPLPAESLRIIHSRVPQAQAILALETLLPGGSPQKPEALLGFRLYDPKTAKVIDEATLTSGSLQGSSTIREVHLAAVEKYLLRICPCYTVYPEPDRRIAFFVRGSPGLEQAKTALIGRQWNEAIATWEKEAQSPNKTAAKRAAYNLALLYDALCNVEKAEEWYRRAVALGLAQREYEAWGQERRSLCGRLNQQVPFSKRTY